MLNSGLAVGKPQQHRYEHKLKNNSLTGHGGHDFNLSIPTDRSRGFFVSLVPLLSSRPPGAA